MRQQPAKLPHTESIKGYHVVECHRAEMLIFLFLSIKVFKEQYPVTAHAPNFDPFDRMSRNQKMRGE